MEKAVNHEGFRLIEETTKDIQNKECNEMKIAEPVDFSILDMPDFSEEDILHYLNRIIGE